MTLEEILADIERAQSTEELLRFLDRVAHHYGFAGFNFIDAGSISRDQPFWLGTVGGQWENEYISNEFAPDDPVIKKALTRNAPFFWSDITINKGFGPKDRARQTMEAAHDYGFRNGFVVPHHFKDDIGRTYSTCTCFFWASALEGFVRSVTVARHDLHLIMIYWTARASQLAHDEQRGRPFPVGVTGDAAYDNRLSDRERDVLLWTARGKTTDDIAYILKVSAVTVNFHIRGAMAKLDASNRTHAVTKAIYLNLIVP